VTFDELVHVFSSAAGSIDPLLAAPLVSRCRKISAAEYQLDDIVDLHVLFDRVTKVLVGNEPVAVAAALPDYLQIAGLCEVVDGLLYGALGDSDTEGNVAHTRIGCLSNADEDVRVIGKESPGLCRRWHIYQL
jgi:hypothetical protein